MALYYDPKSQRIETGDERSSRIMSEFNSSIPVILFHFAIGRFSFVFKSIAMNLSFALTYSIINALNDPRDGLITKIVLCVLLYPFGYFFGLAVSPLIAVAAPFLIYAYRSEIIDNPLYIAGVIYIILFMFTVWAIKKNVRFRQPKNMIEYVFNPFY